MAAAIPEQRSAQERLWRALQRLEYLEPEQQAQRTEAEQELFEAWAEYESARV